MWSQKCGPPERGLLGFVAGAMICHVTQTSNNNIYNT